jgi:hypothetical protein
VTGTDRQTDIQTDEQRGQQRLGRAAAMLSLASGGRVMRLDVDTVEAASDTLEDATADLVGSLERARAQALQTRGGQ